jgi:peptidase M15-like protein
MARSRRPRPVMIRLAGTALALGGLTAVTAARPPEPRVAPPAAGFAVGKVRALTALPGETVTLDVPGIGSGSHSIARSAAGRIVPLGKEAGRWAWTAPLEPGLYPIQVVTPDGRDSITVQAFVVVPYARLQGEVLNGYRIGRYPAKKGPPVGFVEVTPENQDVLVSSHFRLKQFLCKQPAGSRRYVVLNERLLVALEYVIERVRAAGYRATTFHVMSGYRTPAYNRAIGNVQFSQHQWGTAADIFIDENGDGRMDDLNGDGRSDVRDAEVLYRIIDAASTRPEGQGLIGGIGKYPPTRAHGPFVHVDVRPGHARW